MTTATKELLKLCDQIQAEANHNIPYYAYGDNEAACDFSHRLHAILTMGDELKRLLEQQQPKQSGLSAFVHSSPEERERIGEVVAQRAIERQQPKTSEGELLPCPFKADCLITDFGSEVCCAHTDWMTHSEWNTRIEQHGRQDDDDGLGEIYNTAIELTRSSVGDQIERLEQTSIEQQPAQQVPDDCVKALSSLLSKLSEEDRRTFNWLVDVRVKALAGARLPAAQQVPSGAENVCSVTYGPHEWRFTLAGGAVCRHCDSAATPAVAEALEQLKRSNVPSPSANTIPSTDENWENGTLGCDARYAKVVDEHDDGANTMAGKVEWCSETEAKAIASRIVARGEANCLRVAIEEAVASLESGMTTGALGVLRDALNGNYDFIIVRDEQPQPNKSGESV